jgi:hypothetical protein
LVSTPVERNTRGKTRGFLVHILCGLRQKRGLTHFELNDARALGIRLLSEWDELGRFAETRRRKNEPSLCTAPLKKVARAGWDGTETDPDWVGGASEDDVTAVADEGGKSELAALGVIASKTHPRPAYSCETFALSPAIQRAAVSKRRLQIRLVLDHRGERLLLGFQTVGNFL